MCPWAHSRRCLKLSVAMLAKDRRVPRAQLVMHSVRGAQLAALPKTWPPLFVGGRYLATMPYDNLEVLATFRGWLPSQDDLPSHRNAIGDMYLVGNVSFVWLFAPGATQRFSTSIEVLPVRAGG